MQDRIAFVTGGTGGIGSAICKMLVAEGCRVASSYIPVEKEQALKWQQETKADGIDVFLTEGDVTDGGDCERMVKDVEDALGPINVLVNCAGITRDGTFKKMERDQWYVVIDTNLNSVYNVTRPVINGMLERKFGRVINISSLNGRKGQFGQANYSAAKAGMHGFTMALAQETASKGITVNTISPGYIGTSMVMAIPEDIRNQIVAQIPVGRLGQPDEIASLVSYLASDRGAFITGANIDINGGQHMH